MADHGMIFSAPMVRALREGRKTQTRRLLSPSTCTVLGHRYSDKSPGWQGLDFSGAILRTQNTLMTAVCGSDAPYDLHLDVPWQHPDEPHVEAVPHRVRPIVEPGDRLWVRENYWHAARYPGTLPDGEPEPLRWCWDSLFCYAADGTPENALNRHYPDGLRGNRPSAPDPYACWHLRPSIHMPRKKNRLTLTVTDVRLQRLQDISEADAIAEGPVKLRATGRYVTNKGDQYFGGAWHLAKKWYADLWDQLHGEGSWEANPWIVAYTFDVRHANIDALVPA